MRFKANFQYKPASFQMDDCEIEKVVELSHEDFCRLKINPLADQPFIKENKDCMFSEDGVMHCLLALDQGGSDGILVEAEGYDYPRYAAYVPGMRHIVSAEMGYGQERRQVELRVDEQPTPRHEDAEQSMGPTMG